MDTETSGIGRKRYEKESIKNHPLIYIDTSALAKRYIFEDGSDFVDELYEFERSADGQLYTARHTVAEFGSAAMRLMRMGKLRKEEAFGFINTFRKESKEMVQFLDIDESAASMSLGLLFSHPLKAADSLHLACACQIQYRSEDESKKFYFVCDDSALCTAGEKEGMHVLRPRDPGAKDEMKKIYSLFIDDL